VEVVAMVVEVPIELDIPDIRVLSVVIHAQGHYVFCVESILEGARCHKCGRKITEFHGSSASERRG
jgi:hypothetical protein